MKEHIRGLNESALGIPLAEVKPIEYRQLGRSGLRVSVYGLGTNAFGARADEAASTALIHHALDHGVNLIDTSNRSPATPGMRLLSETIMGTALRGRRGQAIVATKCGKKTGDGPNDANCSRGHILREIERSLERLQTDYIDLYQIHWFDPATPLEETLRALDDLVRAGKVRYIGCSNYAAWQLGKALWISDRNRFVRYDAIQPAYSPADRRIEPDLIPLCLDQDVGVLAYYPLAGGILTGKYRPDKEPPSGSRAVTQPGFAAQLSARTLALAEDMRRLAAESGCTVGQLTLAWVMNRPGITSALVGATTVAQQEENLAAVDLAVAPDTLRRITEASDAFVV